VGYIDEMPKALAAADVAVSRAGAMGTAELLAWGIPSILVPLPTAAADHQTHNARALDEFGAAVALPEAEATPERLWPDVVALAGDARRRRGHGRAARERARPDAARRIASELLRIVEGDMSERPLHCRPPGRGAGPARAGPAGPIHFMGVCGAGMSALAEYVAGPAAQATGCDMKAGRRHRPSRSWGGGGTATTPAHVEDARGGGGDLGGARAAPSELEAARARGIPVLKRAAALGALVNAGRVIAVAGTHGKTTTTGHDRHHAGAAGLDPTAFVGGRMPGWRGGLRAGGDLFVVEADEYDRSFLALRPRDGGGHDLEPDHMEIYGDLETLYDAFVEFLDPVPEDGLIAAAWMTPAPPPWPTGSGDDRLLTYGTRARRAAGGATCGRRRGGPGST
jgi:hypothetical protein